MVDTLEEERKWPADPRILTPDDKTGKCKFSFYWCLLLKSYNNLFVDDKLQQISSTDNPNISNSSATISQLKCKKD